MSTETSVQVIHRTSRNVVLPEYFEEGTDLSMLRQCLVARGSDNSTITHLTTVPFHMVDHDNPDFFIDIAQTYSLLQLRRLVLKFEPGRRPATKASAYAMINEIGNLDITVGRLEALAVNKKNADINNLTKMLMRLVGVLFSETGVHYFAQLNDRKKVADFERGGGRNDENFYMQVSEAVNDNENEQHKFLHEFADEDKLYHTYINDEDMDAAIHPSGDDCIQTNAQGIRVSVSNLCKVRNKMNAIMHKSGNGDNDAMSFAANAVRDCKVRSSVTEIAAYYFFMQCKRCNKVTTGIDNTLPDILKTGTKTIQLLFTFDSIYISRYNILYLFHHINDSPTSQ